MRALIGPARPRNRDVARAGDGGEHLGRAHPDGHLLEAGARRLRGAFGQGRRVEAGQEIEHALICGSTGTPSSFWFAGFASLLWWADGISRQR